MRSPQQLEEGALKLLRSTRQQVALVFAEGPAMLNIHRALAPPAPFMRTDLREAFDDAVWRLAKHHHLPLVRVGAEVALEAILIAALLAAHLAIPSQLLQPLRLDAVGYLRSCREHVRGQYSINVATSSGLATSSG